MCSLTAGGLILSAHERNEQDSQSELEKAFVENFIMVVIWKIVHFCRSRSDNNETHSWMLLEHSITSLAFAVVAVFLISMPSISLFVL